MWIFAKFFHNSNAPNLDFVINFFFEKLKIRKDFSEEILCYEVKMGCLNAYFIAFYESLFTLSEKKFQITAFHFSYFNLSVTWTKKFHLKFSLLRAEWHDFLLVCTYFKYLQIKIIDILPFDE